MTKTRKLHTFRSSDYLEGVFRLAEELVLDQRERSELGARYKLARTLKGWTQLELANAINYTERTVGGYERGEVQEGLRPARQWAEATGIRYEWLITGEGDPLPASEADRLGRIEELLGALLAEIREMRDDESGGSQQVGD